MILRVGWILGQVYLLGATLTVVLTAVLAPAVRSGPGLVLLLLYLSAAAVAGLLLAGEAACRRRADEACRASEARYRLLAEHATDWVVRLDRAGVVVYASPACQQLLGCRPEELHGRSLLHLTHADDADRLRQALVAALARGDRVRLRHRLRHRHGGPVWVETHLQALAGPAPELLGLSHDLRTTLRLEEELQRAQKLTAVGQLAAGVAHHFNNLLTVITGYTDLMLGALAADHPWREHLLRSREAADRAAALTRQLQAFARRQPVRPERLDLNALLRHEEQVLRKLLPAHLELRTALDADLHPVIADRHQLEQVIVQLAVNASDAMPRGGLLAITTANVTRAAGQGGPEVRGGTYVRLTVSDTGCGMSPEVLEHLFEPFFTTKEVGQGLGLGLAAVYGIVRQAGGHIEVASKVGRGTRVTIYLPAADAAPAAPVAEPVLSALP